MFPIKSGMGIILQADTDMQLKKEVAPKAGILGSGCPRSWLTAASAEIAQMLSVGIRQAEL